MFRKAIVRPPARTYADGLTSADLGEPIYERALQQHAAYCEALERCGVAVIRLDPDENYPDSTFVEDTAVIVQQGAIMTRPAAPSRAGEVASIRQSLANLCPQIGCINDSGTVDGGDVCQAGSHFFIGISARTNEPGAAQLAELLAACGYSSTLVDIRNEKNILHLKSGVASLDENRLVVIDALADRVEFRGYELVRLKEDETYAANCVRVNDRVLIAAGYPAFQQTLRGLGYETIPLEMSEFQKMDGGLSCLSLRF